MKQAHLIGASLLAISVAGPVFAQTPAQKDTQPPQGQQANDTNGPGENSASNNSGDIVVTATKRAQTLQDTPVSVAVTTSQSIEQSKVRDLLDLQTLVPSLKVSQNQSSANTTFIIRGFGNGSNNIGIEPAVAVFIDGVYRSRSGAQIADLPNIDRVEVIRGPQSTLFGKNASVGAISIITAPPSFKFGGNIEASYGEYNAILVKGSVTGPLSETIAASLAGNYNKRDGYGRDLNLGIRTNDRNRYGVRGQLLFQPSSDFKVRVIGDYDKIDEICCTVANFFSGPATAAINAIGGKINANRPYSFDSYGNLPSVNKIDTYGVSAQFDLKVTPELSITNIAAYRALRSSTNQDSDFTSADLIGSNPSHTSINTYTNEFRLSSDFTGPFNFLLGAFYFKEDIGNQSSLTYGKDFKNYANALSGGAYSGNEALLRALVGLPAATPTTAFGSQGQGRFENYDYHDESISIFGQADLKVLRGLTLTGGFNYTSDRKRLATNNTTTDVFSTIDLVQAAANAGVPAAARTSSCQTPKIPNAGNPFLGLCAFQFLPQFLNLPNAVESGRTKDDNLSYTFRAAYKFDRHVNVYATYATGFKASSLNASTDSRPFATDFSPGSPFQVPAPAASAIRTAGIATVNLTAGTRFAGPEDAEVYEAGLKVNFQGFGANLAVFKQTIKGFQSNIFTGTGFILANAEKESTKGIELDATITPARSLNFTFSMTYLDPIFDKYTGGSAYNPVTQQIVASDLSGQRPSGIPEYSIAVGGNYTAELGDDVRLLYHMDFQFDSSTTVALGLPYKFAPETLNASVTLQLLHGLEVSVFGRNLSEPLYNPVIFPGVAQTAAPSTLSAYPSQPKTYGASVRFRF